MGRILSPRSRFLKNFLHRSQNDPTSLLEPSPRLASSGRYGVRPLGESAMNERPIVKRLILLVPVLLAVLTLTASAYSNFVVSEPSSETEATLVGSGMHRSQLTVAYVDEIALLLDALPHFAWRDSRSE